MNKLGQANEMIATLRGMSSQFELSSPSLSQKSFDICGHRPNLDDSV